ncbi:MAG: peptidylprolyl isomerase [Rhodocyclaceae bacterium]|nr:peptidylprolyl isomerase [Rhodocyclaceae bacterium]MDZ4214593.1 peptidylprolyl isomerase [Rhodocyclaceae bacterium]
MRIFAIITALFALVPQYAAGQVRQPIAVDRIIAVVNDEAITRHELRDRMATIERQLRDRGTPLPPRDVLEKQLLERLIVDRVQMQFAKEVGMRIPDNELDVALRRIAENNRLSLAAFRDALERDGIAWRRFREEIREEMTLARLREREVESRIVISDGEIDNYLAHPEQAHQSALVALGHIIIRVPEQADPTRLSALRARAEDALARIKSGTDFGQVAASYSEAPDAMAGGMIEPRPADRLPTLYAEAVAALKPGEVSSILRSPAGFHIVKLIDRRGGDAVGGLIRQTRARHILIKVNELVSSEEARHKLAGLKERLDNGGDFAELARLYSNDLSAAKGGDLGWLYQGDTVPEFERAMDALAVGEYSKPVQSPFGWHLIQVQERKNAEAGDERKRLIARQALRERKSDEAYEDWLRQMRDRAYVEYRLEER